MSTKHLQTGDARPAFDNTKKFRIYSMKFCPFAQKKRNEVRNVSFNAYRKRKRLVKRVSSIARKKTIGPLVLLYVDGEGVLRASGTARLCEKVKNVAAETFCEELEKYPAGHESDENENLIETAPTLCKKITFDPLAVEEIRSGQWCVDKLRKTVRLLVLPTKVQIEDNENETVEKKRLAHIRNFWQTAEIPGFWPKQIPFCSPSAREYFTEDGVEKIRKVLSKQALIDIILANISFNETERESSESSEEDEQMSNMSDTSTRGGESDVESELEPEASEPKYNHDNSEDSSSKDDASIHDLYKMGDYTRMIKTICDKFVFDGQKIIASSNKIINEERETHNQTSTAPASSKFVSNTGIPQGYGSSKEQKDLYSALSTDPLRLKADVFLYGVAHVHHLASELSRQLKRKLSPQAMFDILKTIIEDTILDVTNSSTKYKCIAGALSASLDVWDKENEVFHVYFPCECDVVKNPVNRPLVSVTQTASGGFVLLEEGKSARTRQGKQNPEYRRTWNAHRERIASLEGISIYRADLASLNPKTWVNDSVIDFMLKYYSLEADKTMGLNFCYPYISFFQQRLLINGPYSFDSREPLDLSGCDIAAASTWTPRCLDKYKFAVVPVCDMTHWWVIVYEIPTGTLSVLCSMGWERNNVAETIKRYFENVRAEQFWSSEIPLISEPTFAKVARQTNNYDCGVFVIEYCRRIMEGVAIGPNLVKTEEVQRRRRALKKIITNHQAS